MEFITLEKTEGATKYGQSRETADLKKKMKIDVDLTKIPRIEPGFYISQFIRYARVCSLYSGLQRRPILSTKLSNHGVLKNRFILSFNGYSKNINA
jgi:hypothetical protein